MILFLYNKPVIYTHIHNSYKRFNISFLVYIFKIESETETLSHDFKYLGNRLADSQTNLDIYRLILQEKPMCLFHT